MKEATIDFFQVFLKLTVWVENSHGVLQNKAPLKVLLFFSCILGDEGRNKLPQRRVYTVLPPPDGYRAGDGDWATFPEPGNINTEGDQAGKKVLILHLRAIFGVGVTP